MQEQSQALLSAILEAAVDSIIVIDAQGTIQAVNDATETMFGFKKDELVGQNVKCLMPSPYREEHDGYLRNHRETGRTRIIGIGREVIGLRNDGKTFPLHLAVSKLPVEGQQLYAGILRDISDLKHAQEQLAEANRELESRIDERTAELRATQAELLKAEKLATLGQVSGGIAHEIRNPLNAVRTSVYYLRHAKSASPDKIGEHLERIDRQVSIIDNVVTALSDVARQPDPKMSECDLGELLTQTLATADLPASIKVQNQLVDQGLCAAGDVNQLSIVFLNLIRNAREAMPDGGTLTLRSRDSETVVQVDIEDSGVGIAEEAIERVTEPLYSTKARGMGLGLAISLAILQKNRATLDVKSRIGLGTTFTVSLQKWVGESE